MRLLSSLSRQRLMPPLYATVHGALMLVCVVMLFLVVRIEGNTVRMLRSFDERLTAREASDADRPD